MQNSNRSSPYSSNSQEELARQALVILQQEKATRRSQRQKTILENSSANATDAVRARCLKLADFVREAWPVLEPSTRLSWNWHLDALCEHLEAVTDGRITRLLVNVPPGTSKSLIVSVLWQAWEWGPKHLSSTRYLATAFNDGPVKRDTRKCRDLMLSEWYQKLWPHVQMVRTAETSFANSLTGTREGLAFGSLTSQRGDRLIIDDPHSTETAESAAERQSTTRKFREGALNRLNDQERSAIVVIMQRLHEEDISGVILALGMGYVHLCLPMEFEPERRCETKIGFVDPRMSDGDLLDPERFSRETVEQLKHDMTAYAYAGQYQQRPSPREGGMFKPERMPVVDARPDPRLGLQLVRGWDLASSRGRGDWTSGTLMASWFNRVGGVRSFSILDVVRFRGSPDEVEAKIKHTAVLDGPQVKISIPEDAGSGGKFQAFYLTAALAGRNVVSSRETGSKETRAEPFASQANIGNVSIVRGDWNSVYLEELRNFPNGAHDDQVDASSRAFQTLMESQGPMRIDDEFMQWARRRA